MSRFLDSRLTGLTPYTPGEQPAEDGLIKLNTNESPFPPSPRVLEAISAAAGDSLRLYPDPEARELIRAAAETWGLEESCVTAGNGSDELLALAFMAYGREICFPEISYGFYPVYARFLGCRAERIPPGPGLAVRLEDFFGRKQTVLLANPNAPTGLAFSREEIRRLLESNRDHPVILDEAYIDFGGESAVPLISRYENLLVIQTLSKSRNLAGARVGIAMGQKPLIGDLNRLRFSFNPYNLNRISIAAAAAAFRDRAYFSACMEAIGETRRWFSLELESMGFEVFPSLANFVFVRPPGRSGQAYFEGLRRRGILVRHFPDPVLSPFVRITVGTREQMEKVAEITRKELLK